MTHICYTLEEAAEKLKLTETVLVRLSQYFKMPKAAYEESGYLSFKGDLAFSEQDLEFFRQAKERLLLGESLEAVKSRIREQGPSVASSPPVTAPSSQKFGAHMAAAQGSPVAGSVIPSEKSALDTNAPMREIQDRQPYEKAAEQSFERYKSIHRTGLGRVFENMLKEVGVTQQEEKKQESAPLYRPMRGRTGGRFDREGMERQLPFNQHYAEPLEDMGSRPESRPMVKNAKSTGEPSWEQMLKQATEQPRTMNSHLKGAAALLRERAMGLANRTQSRFPS